MRTRASIVIAAAALALSGCGAHNLVLKVDILSYLGPTQQQIPVLPAGELPAPVVLVPDETINLIQGLEGIAEVQSVTLWVGAQLAAASGSGTGVLKLLLSDEDTDPLTTQPVVRLPVAFTAGPPGTVAAGFDCGRDLADLFTQRKMRVAVVIDSVVVAPPGATDVTVGLHRLEAIVIAGRKAF